MDMLDRYLQAVKFFLPAEAAGRHRSRTVGEPDRQDGGSRSRSSGVRWTKPSRPPFFASTATRCWSPDATARASTSSGRRSFRSTSLRSRSGSASRCSSRWCSRWSRPRSTAIPSGGFSKRCWRSPAAALMVFAWTTLGFAALDFAQCSLRLVHDWDPRKLPKVVSEEQQIPRLKTLCELSFVLARVGWLLLLPRSPFLILGPAAALVRVRPRLARRVRADAAAGTLPRQSCTSSTSFAPIATRSRELARVAINVGSLFLSAVPRPRPVTCSFPEPLQLLPEASTSHASWRSSTRASGSEWRSPPSSPSSRSGEGCAGLNAGTARRCRRARPTHAPDAKTYVSSHDSRPRL